MRIVSWNVNGIRAVERKKDLHHFLEKQNADIIFFQETKAHPEQLSNFLTEHKEYHQHYHAAEKKGYSGVSLWLRKSIDFGSYQILSQMPGWQDTEGRIIGFNFKKIYLFGVYFPNGGKSKQAWQEKLLFYDHFLEYVNSLRQKGNQVIWCGDLNVAHNEIDLARPKENLKSIGFLPEERAWMDRVMAAGWSDVFRRRNPKLASYTWWSMVTQARQRDIGWRIDYFLVDEKYEKKIIDMGHSQQQMGSDHCPIWLEIKL